MSKFLSDSFLNLFGINASPYPQSIADNEPGMSKPVVEKNQTSLADAAEEVASLTAGATEPTTTEESTTSPEATAPSVFEAVTGGLPESKGEELIDALLTKARGYKKMGQAFGTVSDAGALFEDIVNFGTQRKTNALARENVELSADNQIMAIENEALYTKNQLSRRFNELTARTAVVTAAKGLAVSASSILEQNKETAHDINVDFRTLESNVKLNEIALTNLKEQAKIAEELNNSLQIANVISDAGKLTMSASGSFFGGYDKLASKFNKWFPTKTGVKNG